MQPSGPNAVAAEAIRRALNKARETQAMSRGAAREEFVAAVSRRRSGDRAWNRAGADVLPRVGPALEERAAGVIARDVRGILRSYDAQQSAP